MNGDRAFHAEHAVLGAIMFDPDCIHEVSTIVESRDFRDPGNAKLFDCLLYCLKHDIPVDPVSVAELAENNGSLDAVGGLRMIGEIARNNPTSVNVAAYAHVVREQSQLRRIGVIASGIAARCEERGAWVPAVLDDAITELTRLLMSSEREQRGLKHVSEYIEPAVKQIEDAFLGTPVGLSTHIKRLDAKLGGLRKGELIVVAARPSQGKTAIGVQIAADIAAEHKGAAIALYSLEMSAESIVHRMLANRQAVNLFLMRKGELADGEWQKITNGIAELNASQIRIDDTSSLSASDVCARTRALASRRDVDLQLVVVDFLQRMRFGDHEGKNRNEKIGSAVRQLKNLAMDLQMPVILLSQLNRESEKRSGGRPTLADLRESGEIEQDADAVVLIHRKRNKKDDEPDLLIVDKNRNGPTGDVPIDFDGASTRFRDVDGDIATERGGDGEII